MLLAEIVDTWQQVRATRSRLRKVELLSETLGRLEDPETEIGVSFLAGVPRQGRLGVGYRAVQDVDVAPAAAASLTLRAVDDAFTALTAISGPGSQTTRAGILSDLLESATEDEQDLLRGLILHNIRQGALEGVMIEAVARVSGAQPERMRRAVMLSGSLVAAATAALRQGPRALDKFGLEVFRPIKPMLAQTAAEVAAALDKTGPASVEVKYDGARIQAHLEDGTARIFTRNLRDVSESMLPLVEVVGGLPARRLILDGEAMSVAADGRPVSFQEIISEFSREESTAAGVLAPFFFDCMLRDDRVLIDEPLQVRMTELEGVVPDEMRVPRVITDDPAEGVEFFQSAIDLGHEGVVIKAVGSRYEAGRRGGAWFKVKPSYTLDLVVLAAEWGSGRRQGWLSNLHLGARDQHSGEFVMLGKTFKGLTDEMLQWQTDRFLELETRREGHIVYLRPEQVVEIAFDGVQTSRRYPGGVALRFARVKIYRTDKGADEADTIDTIRAIHRGRPPSA